LGASLLNFLTFRNFLLLNFQELALGCIEADLLQDNTRRKKDLSLKKGSRKLLAIPENDRLREIIFTALVYLLGWKH